MTMQRVHQGKVIALLVGLILSGSAGLAQD